MLPMTLARRCSNEWFPGFGSLMRWSDHLDNLLDGRRSDESVGGFRVDIREEGDRWLIEAEVPGLSKDDIDITVENGVLTIAGEVKTDETKSAESYHVRERRYGRFERSFRLGEGLDSGNVTADLKNGILTVAIPRSEEAKPRRIEVK